MKFYRLFVHVGILELTNDLVGGFAHHQRFGLCEIFREEFVMMITKRVMGDCRSEEIARNYFRPLMDQLIKCVLPIRSRLTPDDRSGLISHRLAGAVNRFSVAF